MLEVDEFRDRLCVVLVLPEFPLPAREEAEIRDIRMSVEYNCLLFVVYAESW
jgi:hypothetical protein